MTLHKAGHETQLQENTGEKNLEVQDGRWWKFTHYAIHPGQRGLRGGGTLEAATRPGPHRPMIRPEPDSALHRYDPWEAYRRLEGKRRTVSPPYQAFLELARNLAFVPRPGSVSFAPTPESEAAILAWCQEFGLLGILSARAEIITLAPEWVPRSKHLNVPSAQGFCASYRRYVRRSGVWSTTGEIVDVSNPPLTEEEATPARLRESVPTKPWKGLYADNLGYRWPKPGAVIWRWERGNSEEEPLLGAVYRYFPDVPLLGCEVWDYPRPCSEQFWYAYGEPVADFAHWAVQFMEAVEIVSRFEPMKGTDAEERRKQHLRTNDALYFLEGLAESTGRPRRFEAGTHQLVHDVVAPSLLSAFAEMFLQDAEVGRRAARCHTCGRFFVSDEPRAQYCSARCRSTMQRRRQRQREDVLE
jgi:hypothetical protein